MCYGEAILLRRRVLLIIDEVRDDTDRMISIDV
jgi:hypothetical protein